MKNLIRSFFVSLFLMVTFALTVTDTNAQGCIMCKAQVGESKDQDEAKLVGTSLNAGILYLMAIPYLLVGTVGFIWYRNNKKKSV